jgi:hypothetical protein
MFSQSVLCFDDYLESAKSATFILRFRSEFIDSRFDEFEFFGHRKFIFTCFFSACVQQRCEDPCVGSCGFNALCNVHNHQPICSCFDGYEGDPYSGCNVRQGECKTAFISHFLFCFCFLNFHVSLNFVCFC